ncbi:MAG: glycosyltransferase family 1 protein [Microgenomates group bacterium]
MRIGIDCRLSGVSHAGIGRYIENLIRELSQFNSKHTFVLFFFETSQRTQAFGTKIPNNFEIVYAPVRHYSIKEQLQLPGIFLKEKLDILHVPHFNIPIFYPKTILTTIHDLLWHEVRGSRVTTLPFWQYWAKYLFYLLVTRIAVWRSKIIFVPANTILNTIESYYPGTKNKIKVTYEGIDERISKVRKPSQNPVKGQLLYVGSLYPHKNVNVILQALKQLPNHSLSIVGARNQFQTDLESMVKKEGLTNQVKFLGFLTDAELANMYRSSEYLIQPSLSEGFGLTGLEAISLGTPVLASDIPIFHEIYQDQAHFFDPHNSNSLVDAIKKTPKIKSVQNSQVLLQQYSWKKMASETLLAYESAQ